MLKNIINIEVMNVKLIEVINVDMVKFQPLLNLLVVNPDNIRGHFLVLSFIYRFQFLQ